MLVKRDLAEKYPMMDAYTMPLGAPSRAIVGREEEMKAVLASMQRPELCNVMLLAEAGTGKGHPLDAWIPVADERGYIQFKDICVGDQVFDENGFPVSVTGVYPQGQKEVFRVTFEDGTSVFCNDEHLWNVRTRWEHFSGKPYRTRSLREMMESDQNRYGYTKHGAKQPVWYVPVNRPVFRKDRPLPIPPYTMGALIANGCLTCSDLTISTTDEEVVARIRNEIGAVGYKRCSEHNFSWIFEDAGNVKYRKTAAMAGLDSCLDVAFFKKSVDRRIPPVYFLGSAEQRMELLRGLMDGDGSLSSDDRLRCTFATSSSGLCNDFVRLCQSLGIRATYSKRRRQGREAFHPEHAVYLRIPDDLKQECFWLRRYHDMISEYRRYDRQFHRHYDDLAIVSIEDLGYETEMVCIMVNGESHLYQTGFEHIVTHNTALVQGVMSRDKDRTYLEVDLARMLADLPDANQMAARLKKLFDEVSVYVASEGRELVLFIDEFHQIVQMSPAAVEALKPLLARSGSMGVRVIGATTFDEFRQWISPNQALTERLQRFNLAPPGPNVVVEILRNMAKTYGVLDELSNDNLFHLICEYTDRYIPASNQPRKSIRVFDAMLGWHRAYGRRLDTSLLGDVIYESEGVRVAFKVDATQIKAKLDRRVYAQEFATKVIADRLQSCVAGLNDSTKPMASFLFAGSTGVGKTEVTKALAELLFADKRSLHRFDMTEFSNPNTQSRFSSELTARVWERPYSVILLDEIEKACPEVTKLLLQVLDDGRLTDDNGREVSFINSYIIMTTNAGSEVFDTIAQYRASDQGSEKIARDYDKLFRRSISETTGDNRFPTELINRIDCIVPFQPLSENTMERIARTKLAALKNLVMQKQSRELSFSKNMITYLVEENMDTQARSGGARQVVRKIENEITVRVAEYINRHPDVYRIHVAVKGRMACEHPDIRESEAYIVVDEYRSRAAAE